MFRAPMKYLRLLSIPFIVCFLGVFFANIAFTENMVGEETISLEITGQPLGEVLDEIEDATGYRFILDESWENFLISASIKNEPLHKGLKRILRNLNNVIIYSSNRTIKIIIFDEAAASVNRPNAVSDRTSDARTLQQSYALPVGSLPAPQRANRRLLDVEDDNRISEESDAAVNEPDEALPGEEEPRGDETDESTAEAGGADRSQQTEDTPDVNDKSPDESENVD